MLTTGAAAAKDRRSGKCRMEHRHFATIAAILQDMTWLSPRKRQAVVDHFATQLSDTNPRFDRCRFLRACGIMEV